jgi:hypothetical protein
MSNGNASTGAERTYPLRILSECVNFYLDDPNSVDLMRVLSKGDIVFALQPSSYYFPQWIPVATRDGQTGRIDSRTAAIEIHCIRLISFSNPVRSSPFFESPVVEELDRGTELIVLDYTVQGGTFWYRIMDKRLRKGYISTNLLMERIDPDFYGFGSPFQQQKPAWDLGSEDDQDHISPFTILEAYLDEYRRTGVEPSGTEWGEVVRDLDLANEIQKLIWRCPCGEINIRSAKHCRICFEPRAQQ